MRAIRNVNQLITQEKDRGRLIQRACQLLTEGRGYFTAWIVLLKNGEKTADFAVAGDESDSARLRQLLQQGEMPRCACRALKSKDLVVIDDLSPDSGCFLWENYQDRGVLTIPLAHKNYSYGVLGVLLPVNLSRDAEELSLFQELAADLSLALYNLDLEEREYRAQEALKASEEKFRLLVENAPDAIFIRTENEFAYLNKEALRLFGASTKEQLLGRPVLASIHPDFRELVKERMRLVNEARQALPCLEQKILKLGGTPIDVEVSVVPFRYQGKNGGLVFVRDITERKEAERTQKVLEAQLAQAQKMEALGTLAGGIAHDFNNILGAMLGFAELAQMGLPEESEGGGYLGNLLKAGDRARSLVKQILSFSRQEKAARQPLSLTPIIKETLKFLRASLPTTIEIQTHLYGGRAMVEADPTQIHQILLNLATNAAHAMEDQGGILEIDLKTVDISPEDVSLYEATPPGPYLELKVSDTGHGIEPEILGRIFEPFFTTKEPWKGTGMGLAVVYGIVKSMAGSIKVTSQPGQGTTFWLLLPMVEMEPVEAAPEILAPLTKGEGRVLFVDDDTDFFQAGKQMLSGLGYKVAAYANSQTALDVFKADSDSFDLLICDQTMPGLTGLELAAACSRLRPDLPIILCTGFSEIVTPEKAKAAGVGEVVIKPFNLRQIGESIKKVLKKNTTIVE